MAETVWERNGAWLTRRGCRQDEPMKWELGATTPPMANALNYGMARLSREDLAALREAIDAQIGPPVYGNVADGRPE